MPIQTALPALARRLSRIAILRFASPDLPGHLSKGLFRSEALNILRQTGKPSGILGQLPKRKDLPDFLGQSMHSAQTIDNAIQRPALRFSRQPELRKVFRQQAQMQSPFDARGLRGSRRIGNNPRRTPPEFQTEDTIQENDVPTGIKLRGPK